MHRCIWDYFYEVVYKRGLTADFHRNTVVTTKVSYNHRILSTPVHLSKGKWNHYYYLQYFDYFVKS